MTKSGQFKSLRRSLLNLLLSAKILCLFNVNQPLDRRFICNYHCYIMAANSRFAMATHIMASLALKGEETVSSSYLADSLNTNPVVVRRILGDLQKAGLLETQAGRTGGAVLARKPESITLFDVYAAVDEGELFAYNPNDPNKKCAISCEMNSVLEPIFKSANRALSESLKNIRLSEMVAKLAKKCAARAN